MAKMSKSVSRVVVLVVAAAVIVGVAYYAFFRGPDMKTVTGKFTAAVGVYPGTPVKILGVNVGDVTSVSPKGGYVSISMEYDSQYKIPKDSHAVLVANSLVSDRYVQLDVYKSGPVMPDHGTIIDDGKHTVAPAELDDIYRALNTLSVALGPNGANKGGQNGGALSTLLKVSAANLQGNGAALGNSISKLADAAQTLAGARGNLFQTVGNLRKFTDALKSSDGQIRKFNAQLAQVAGDLADERTDLGLALHDLTIALDQVSTFIKNNQAKFHTSIVGLKNITAILVRQKASLNETLAIAPFALANIVHAYQPNIGVIATRGNLSSLTDPGQICTLLKNQGLLAGTLLGPLTGTITTVCNQVIAKLPAGGLPGLGGIDLGGILSGKLPSFPIGGN